MMPVPCSVMAWEARIHLELTTGCDLPPLVTRAETLQVARHALFQSTPDEWWAYCVSYMYRDIGSEMATLHLGNWIREGRRVLRIRYRLDLEWPAVWERVVYVTLVPDGSTHTTIESEGSWYKKDWTDEDALVFERELKDRDPSLFHPRSERTLRGFPPELVGVPLCAALHWGETDHAL